MDPAFFVLHLPSRSLDEAQALADAIDDDAMLDALAVSVNETDESLGLWNTVAYFESREQAELASDRLRVPAAEITPLAARDWVRESLAGLASVNAGRFHLHGSHDRHLRREGGVTLEIDAGTAFGTGHHHTTTGCLLALDGLLKKHRPVNVLDLGCGTGVLALACFRAARSATLATDIDPEAVRVTRLNARQNGVGLPFRAIAAPGLKSREISARAPYDLVMANILARPLASMAFGLSRLLQPGGTLILSGLTSGQVRWIEAVYRAAGLVIERRLILAGWATLVLVRPRKTERPVRRGAGRQGTGAIGPGWEEA